MKNFRKFMPLFVIAILATLLVVQSFAAAPQQDAEGYYLLGTKADLEWFRDQVNSGSYSLKAKLTADIDLKGSETDQWTPIGDRRAENKAYAGIFNGQNHTVSGLYIANSGSSDIGFFASVAGGSVRNLTVKGNISVEDSTSGYDIGGICGDAGGSEASNCIFENCVSDVEITVDASSGYGGSHIGGIIGYIGTGDYDSEIIKISKCTNNAKITFKASDTASGNGIGGILGYVRCRKDGTHTAKAEITVENCTNSGVISGDKGDLGGICGKIKMTYETPSIMNVASCVNKGNITGTSDTKGGVAGEVEVDDTDTLIISKSGYMKGTAEKGIGAETGTFTKDITEYTETPVKPSAPVIDDSVKVPETVDTNPAVEAENEEEAKKALPTFASSIETLGDGMAYVKTDDAKTIVAKAFTSESIEAVTSLPILKATTGEAGKVVAISSNLAGNKIKATASNIDDIDMRKLTGTATALKFTRISDASKAEDGTFIVLDSKGKAASGDIDDNEVYQLVMFIKDNGEYDLDKTDKVIIDPAALTKSSTTPTPTPSSGGGGGCNAGAAAAMLVFCGLPMFFRKKK